MEVQSLIADIAASFMDPLQAALGGVASVAMPLLDSAVVLVIGFTMLIAAFGGRFPAGALMQSLITIGLAMAAITYWPDIISKSVEQVAELGGLADTNATSPFEVATAGVALATLAFDHAGAVLGYMSGYVTAGFFALAGVGILVAYLVITGLSLMAWVEFWAAAVILAPLVALLPIMGFSSAGFVPFSFLLSSTIRIAAISLVATYGSGMISEYAIPGIDEAVTWLHGFIAFGLAAIMLMLAWGANSLIGGIVQGRSGFAGGMGAMKGAVMSAVSSVAGGGVGSAATSAGSARSSSASSTGDGRPGSTSRPVNSRST
jgi:hypothetical protein